MFPLLVIAGIAAFAAFRKKGAGAPGASTDTSGQAAAATQYYATSKIVGPATEREAEIFGLLNEAVSLGFKPAAVQKLAREITDYFEGKKTYGYFLEQSQAYANQNMPKTAAHYLKVYEYTKAKARA